MMNIPISTFHALFISRRSDTIVVNEPATESIAVALSFTQRKYVYFIVRVAQLVSNAKGHQFLCMLLMAVARPSSDGVAIRFVLPILRMTSCFHTLGPIGRRTGTALCTSSPVAADGARKQSCCPGGHDHVTSPWPRLFSRLGVLIIIYVSSQRL